MLIKFVKTKKMLTWKGAGGVWRDGQEQDLRDDVAERLLNLFESPFVKVGEKSISPSSDKMIHSAPEVKEPAPPKNSMESLRPTRMGKGKKKKKR